MRNVLRKGKDNLCQDQPDDSDEYSIQLEVGDIIITGTDGVFDNLFNHEIHQIVKTYKDEQYEKARKERKDKKEDDHPLPCMLHSVQQAEELAKRIVEAARAKVDAGAKNQRVKTPYERKYKKTYNATWDGGKEDDITTLVTLAAYD